jgi:hypothetical protein
MARNHGRWTGPAGPYSCPERAKWQAIPHTRRPPVLPSQAPRHDYLDRMTPSTDQGPATGDGSTPDEGSRRAQSPGRRLGGKKVAITILVLLIVGPMALITLGVVAVPVISIPALIILLAAVFILAASRTKQEGLPDERDRQR